jgi:hypothetical protein
VVLVANKELHKTIALYLLVVVVVKTRRHEFPVVELLRCEELVKR